MLIDMMEAKQLRVQHAEKISSDLEPKIRNCFTNVQ